MLLYLASRFDHVELMALYKGYIEKRTDIQVCSRWIEHHRYVPQMQAAIEDFEDIQKCDTLMFFSENPTVGYNSGGRHVELGIALALNKQIWVIGRRENVFHYYPERMKHFSGFLKWFQWYNPQIFSRTYN